MILARCRGHGTKAQAEHEDVPLPVISRSLGLVERSCLWMYTLIISSAGNGTTSATIVHASLTARLHKLQAFRVEYQRAIWYNSCQTTHHNANGVEYGGELVRNARNLVGTVIEVVISWPRSVFEPVHRSISHSSYDANQCL